MKPFVMRTIFLGNWFNFPNVLVPILNIVLVLVLILILILVLSLFLFCSQLSQKDPDEIEVERDFTIRKRIKGIYNKTADSFPSDLEYKNYEETIEDVIFNLVNNIDVQLTNKQVEQYQSDHLQQVSDKQYHILSVLITRKVLKMSPKHIFFTYMCVIESSNYNTLEDCLYVYTAMIII